MSYNPGQYNETHALQQGESRIGDADFPIKMIDGNQATTGSAHRQQVLSSS
jgi:hypothetical protein